MRHADRNKHTHTQREGEGQTARQLMMGIQKLTSTLSCQSQKLTDLNQQKSTLQPKHRAEHDSPSGQGSGVVWALKYKISAWRNDFRQVKMKPVGAEWRLWPRPARRYCCCYCRFCWCWQYKQIQFDSWQRQWRQELQRQQQQNNNSMRDTHTNRKPQVINFYDLFYGSAARATRLSILARSRREYKVASAGGNGSLQHKFNEAKNAARQQQQCRHHNKHTHKRPHTQTRHTYAGRVGVRGWGRGRAPQCRQ